MPSAGEPIFFLLSFLFGVGKGAGAGRDVLLSKMCYLEVPNSTTHLSHIFCPMLNFNIYKSYKGGQR